MKVLGIETSCDETGAAIVENGSQVLANIVASSIKLQQKYGGVVPEVAAREQVKVIIPVIDEALKQANLSLPKIDAIAVTYGPGLIGSLLVGVETAKTLAWVFEKSLIPVNHLVGHFYANFIGKDQPRLPAISLIVSGGHTDLVLVNDHSKYRWLGGTRDDAVGEVFDKTARLLGLGYPGGPEVQKIAVAGKNGRFALPRPMLNSPGFDFSFSGLKTAVVDLWKNVKHNPQSISDIAASFQTAIVEVLVTKTIKAAQKYGVAEIVVGGGVAANTELKKKLQEASNKLAITARFPAPALAIDNAAMIAVAAYFNFKPQKVEEVQAQPGLYFES